MHRTRAPRFASLGRLWMAGITFFDCWEYHRGNAEAWMGCDRVFLMTKVCTHGRDGALCAAHAR
jgi:aryl-alcohol dehydrogenase-like predicted oxidoreductase